jgi:RNA polymerase sigma-70 factor (ECF subfamily)
VSSAQDIEWSPLRARLIAFFRPRVASDDVAEDLAQDVLVKVHQKLGSLRDDGRIGGWISQIARNRLTDHYRGKGKPAPAPDTVIDDGDEPTSELNRLVGSWLLARIDNLPETYREAVRMAEVDGVPQRQIAEHLGLSVSGAKSRVQRGRKLLRADLERCCQVEVDGRGNVLDIRPRVSSCC